MSGWGLPSAPPPARVVFLLLPRFSVFRHFVAVHGGVYTGITTGKAASGGVGFNGIGGWPVRTTLSPVRQESPRH